MTVAEEARVTPLHASRAPVSIPTSQVYAYVLPSNARVQASGSHIVFDHSMVNSIMKSMLVIAGGVTKRSGFLREKNVNMSRAAMSSRALYPGRFDDHCAPLSALDVPQSRT